MGFFYLIFAKLAGLVKVVAVKKCGSAASGAKNSIKINLIRAIGCLAVSVAVFLFSRSALDKNGTWISLLSGIFNAVFLFLWILTAERVSLCLVELFCMIGSVVVPLILAPFLYKGEHVLWHQWICTGILVASTFFFFPKSDKKKRLDWKAFLLLVGCAVGSAGTVITQKLFITYSNSNISVFNLMTFLVVSVGFAVVFFASFAKEKAHANHTESTSESFSAKVWMLIGLATVMLYANQFLSTQASKYFSSGVFYPLLYAIGWPLTFVADICIFKEKVTWKKLVGLVLTITASILISL